MASEDNVESKSEMAGQAWKDGLSRVGSNAAVKLFRSGQFIEDGDLFQGWLETIDLMMEYMAGSTEDIIEWKQRSPEGKRQAFRGKVLGYKSFVNAIQRVINVMNGEAIKDQGKIKQDDKETIRKIISNAFCGRLTVESKAVLILVLEESLCPVKK